MKEKDYSFIKPDKRAFFNQIKTHVQNDMNDKASQWETIQYQNGTHYSCFDA